uniref:WD_REPEATS_REGION domain-containing protein n=1 Tax=Mesocestoides corti TaxID=53468 RepID=A0A5K3FH39_MESCO
DLYLLHSICLTASATDSPTKTTSSGTQQTKANSSTFQFVTQELSLLSSAMGQYKVEKVDLDGPDCTVKIVLYYCRRDHYHHRTICGFDSAGEGTVSRHRSDSLPLADLDALFQSTTTTGSPNAKPSNDVVEGPERDFGALPNAGTVILTTHFSPAYPSPNCPPSFEFSASYPVIHESVLGHILEDIRHTAESTVSTSRGCLEPCIRKVFKHLNYPTFPLFPYERIEKNEDSLASSDPNVSVTQDHPDVQRTVGADYPPSRDVFVPLPRTSGVSISPSGLMVTFGLHQSLIEIVQASTPVPLGLTRMPRSFHEYLQLTEGKEHLFRKSADDQLAKTQIRPSRFCDQHCNIQCPLPRSRSAEILVARNTDHAAAVQESSLNVSGASLKSFDSAGNPIRQRHFSGKTPTLSRKVSDSISSRKIKFIVGSDQVGIESQRRQLRRASFATRFMPARKGSVDPPVCFGSPRVIVCDLSSLIPMSKNLAGNYSLDIFDPVAMCSHNLEAVCSSGRSDLVQFWSMVASLAGMKLRQPPFPGMLPPYASQSMGRSFFNVWVSHFLALGDVQSLILMGFVMAAIDLQSAPPSLLIFPAPSFSVVDKPHRAYHHNPENQKSPVRRSYQHVPLLSTSEELKSVYSGRSKSTVAPPDSSLLEAAELQFRTHVEQPHLVSSSKKHPSKRFVTTAAEVLAQQPTAGCRGDRSPIYRAVCDDGLAAPSHKRARSSSCSVDPSSSTDKATTGFSEAPQCLPVNPHCSDITSVENPHASNVVLLNRCFQDQVLMDVGGATGDPSLVDVAYNCDAWLLSFAHVLQYTHFLNVYASLLSAWDLIMPRAKLSMQWHKVLSWLHARSRPNYYESLSDSTDQQKPIFSPPLDRLLAQPPAPQPTLFDALAIHAEASNIAAPPPTKASHVRCGLQGQRSLVCCVVCNVTVRGIILACPRCSHGGHMEHISAWCMRKGHDQSRPVCPVPNCNCYCGYMKITEWKVPIDS